MIKNIVIHNKKNLDIRRAVGGQVDVEAVAVVVDVTTQLLVDQDHPVAFHRLIGLDDGTHWGEGRNMPLNMAA